MSLPRLGGSNSRGLRSMRRYLIFGVIAEAVGIALLFFTVVLFQGAHQLSFSDSIGCLMGPKFVCKNPSEATVWKLNDLAHEGMHLSFELDILDNYFPFLVGFPAITVLSLWTFDRRRKQKTSAS
jgi:hypothetical protein